MISIVQDLIEHMFIYQMMTRGFKTQVIRRTEANPNAATYKSFQLFVIL